MHMPSFGCFSRIWYNREEQSVVLIFKSSGYRPLGHFSKVGLGLRITDLFTFIVLHYFLDNLLTHRIIDLQQQTKKSVGIEGRLGG